MPLLSLDPFKGRFIMETSLVWRLRATEWTNPYVNACEIKKLRPARKRAENAVAEDNEEEEEEKKPESSNNREQEDFSDDAEFMASVEDISLPKGMIPECSSTVIEDQAAVAPPVAKKRKLEEDLEDIKRVFLEQLERIKNESRISPVVLK